MEELKPFVWEFGDAVYESEYSDAARELAAASEACDEVGDLAEWFHEELEHHFIEHWLAATTDVLSPMLAALVEADPSGEFWLIGDFIWSLTHLEQAVSDETEALLCRWYQKLGKSEEATVFLTNNKLRAGNFSLEELKVLINSDDIDVLREMAKSENTPTAALELLVQSNDPEIRGRARHALEDRR